LNRSVRVTLVALAVLVASSQRSFADTTTLVCDNTNPSYHNTFTIDIDEGRQTVTGGTKEDKGPHRAVFDSKTITWTEIYGPANNPNEETDNITLDRLTGSLSMTSNGVRFPNIFTCHVGKAQF
jgi:hypothetical protein